MQFLEKVLISAQDQLPISLLIAMPDTSPIGIVQLAHGMAEHKERYRPFMEFLAKNGFVVAINDHRGHGKSVRSQEDLGYFYTNGAQALIQDMLQITKEMKAMFSSTLPYYLFGHSMGSMAVRAYARENAAELDGLIVCGSPSDNPAKGMGKLLAKIIGLCKGMHYRSRLINGLAFGAFAKSVRNARTTYDWLSTDTAVVDAYIQDSFCGYTFTINGFISLFELMAMTYAKKGWQVKNAALPIWFISGGEDPCRGNDKQHQKSLLHLQKQGYCNVSGKLYPGMRHEILNELGKEAVYEDILHKLLQWNAL